MEAAIRCLAGACCTAGESLGKQCLYKLCDPLESDSVVTRTDKKQKRKKGRAATGGNAEEALAIVLFEDDTEQLLVNPDLPNLDAWRPGRVLQIGDTKFSIVYNPPTAEKVQPTPHSGCCSSVPLLLSDPCVTPDSRSLFDSLLLRTGSDLWRDHHWLPCSRSSRGRVQQL